MLYVGYAYAAPAYCVVWAQVYAVDLLGFGDSEKAVLDYSIELWRDLVLDFAGDFIDKPYVLVGNSLGSLVSLAAAKKGNDDDRIPPVNGVALINCAGAMRGLHFRAYLA
jgi:pimeloyl-ACP methyl ester carboxylesterase